MHVFPPRGHQQIRRQFQHQHPKRAALAARHLAAAVAECLAQAVGVVVAEPGREQPQAEGVRALGDPDQPGSAGRWGAIAQSALSNGRA